MPMTLASPAMTFDVRLMLDSLRADNARTAGEFDRDPLWSRLSPQSSRLMQRYVRYLAGRRPGVYGLFAHEDELLVALADAVESEASTQLLGEREMEAALAVLAGHRWLLAASLVNVMAPAEPIQLGDVRVLVPTWDPPNADPSQRWVRAVEQSPDASMRRVFGGHSINVGARIHVDMNELKFDTRHTVSLVTVEEGSLSAARERAQAVARFCVAVWTLLSPPRQDMYTPLWPAATEWLPAPHLHVQARAVLLEPQAGKTRHRQQGMSLHYQPDEQAMYVLPKDWRLMAPLQAIDAAASSRAAASLLSAAWSLYLAARVPSDLHWLDRLVYVMQARDALCEPLDRERETVDERWLAAIKHCRVLAGLRRLGFDSADLNAVRRRARQMRNLGVHSADASLLSLGYPPDRVRMLDGVGLSGAELAPAYVREGTAPAFHAVRLLAAEMWSRAVKSNFDDELHDRVFT
jgi:hypothetical protein